MITKLYKLFLLLISPLVLLLFAMLFSGDNVAAGTFVAMFLIPIVFLFKVVF